MTLEQRQQAVLAALKDIETRYGLRVVAVIPDPKRYNPGAIMMEATLALDPVPGWIEPEPPKPEKS